MSKLSDLFHKVDAFFDAWGAEIQVPEPQVGMTWHLSQRRPWHYPVDGGVKRGLASYQIVTLDDKKIGIMERETTTYRLYKREKWDDIYQDNFHRPRGTNRLGGGKIIPEYIGITEPRSLKHITANIISFGVLREPPDSIVPDERHVEPLIRMFY